MYTDENGKERIAYKLKDAEREILMDSNGDPVTKDYEGDEEKLIIEKATSVFDQVREGDTVNFDMLVEEYTEDESFETYPKGYYITEDSYYPLPEVQKAVFEMKVGECKMVRSENGLHVIMRYEPTEGAYALSEYEDLFVAKSTGTYIFMNDLVSKLMTDYVASYKEKVVIDKSLLDGVDIKSAGINYHY